MNLTTLVEAIDAQVLAHDIIGAFDKYAADHCITFSDAHDKTFSKAEKMQGLQWFMSNIASINKIERAAVAVVNDQETHSQFLFDFTHNSGQPMVYSEVIRRVWADGQLVEEQYLLGQTLAVAAEEPATSTGDKKATPKKSTAKAAKKDDLTIVEGIGPKIAELLTNAGIVTFADLAASTPEAIKAVLEAAGKRYQMHDPSTWPQQGALARDGKTAELQQLQDELKGGKA